MAKKTGKGENATADDVAAMMVDEPMAIPPAPSDAEFDRANAQVLNSGTVAERAPAGDDLMERLASAMEAIAAQRGGTSNNDALMERLATAFERIAGAQLEGADRIARATKTAGRPDNQSPPGISVFNPRGDKDFPKPPLKAQIFAPWPVEHESITREEVELFNLIQPGDYIVVRNDGTKAKFMVKATYKMDSDVMDRILINHDTAFNNDNHTLIPPLTSVLRQMLKQNPKTRTAADRVLSMDEESALIEAGQLNDGTVPDNKHVISLGE